MLTLASLFRPEISLAVYERLYSALHIIFSYCHPLVFPFFVASPSFLRAVTAPIQHADLLLDLALKDSLHGYERICVGVCYLFQVLARLLSELVTMNFTEAQRRVLHQLATAYNTAYHAMSKVAKLIPNYKPNVKSAPCAELTNQIATKFVKLGERLHYDCPEHQHTAPIPRELSDRLLRDAVTYSQIERVRA